MCAHESPLSLMNWVGCEEDYAYALVHHFENNEEGYFDYFKRMLAENKEVVLDNSIFELKEAFEGKEFVKWIERLEPTYYIIPDVLEEGYSTMTNFVNWVKEYKEVPGMKMGVVQGTTYQEIADCYNFMKDYADYVCISFDMSYYNVTGLGREESLRRCTGRQRLVQQLIDDGHWAWHKPHHLLGCSLAREFKWYIDNNIYNIRSLDTSNPVIAGIAGKTYNGTLGLEEEFHLADKLGEVFRAEEFSDDIKDDIKYNIESFQKIVS